MCIFFSTTAVPIKIVYSELVLGIIENELYMLFILFEFFFFLRIVNTERKVLSLIACAHLIPNRLS